MHVYANSSISTAKSDQHRVRIGARGSAYNFHATCNARKAILGPTPGNEHSSSTVLGTSPLNSSLSFCAACLMYLSAPMSKWRQARARGLISGSAYCVLRRQKPTLHMASETALSLAARTASMDRVPPTASRSFATAASVTSSFVCDDSISETRVEKRWFCHGWQSDRTFRENHGDTATFGSVSLSCA